MAPKTSGRPLPQRVRREIPSGMTQSESYTTLSTNQNHQKKCHIIVVQCFDNIVQIMDIINKSEYLSYFHTVIT